MKVQGYDTKAEGYGMKKRQPTIQSGSHIDKEIKKTKWKAMQEAEERIAVGSLRSTEANP